MMRIFAVRGGGGAFVVSVLAVPGTFDGVPFGGRGSSRRRQRRSFQEGPDPVVGEDFLGQSDEFRMCVPRRQGNDDVSVFESGAVSVHLGRVRRGEGFVAPVRCSFLGAGKSDVILGRKDWFGGMGWDHGQDVPNGRRFDGIGELNKLKNLIVRLQQQYKDPDRIGKRSCASFGVW